ncbi:hypothetical protein AZKH_1373 [Azoarcus sp. KH32C]|nr:hypothetical protein AZKH_1373 [Azoarcus sp. KH32C]
MKEATLWRYLSAGRYYITLQQELERASVSTESLDTLSVKVSPENLELLAKLSRVMPGEKFVQLAERVINQSITRKELRQLWELYRPVLQGRTARGLGVTPPSVNLDDHAQYSTLGERSLLAALTTDFRKISGDHSLDFVHIFTLVRPLDVMGVEVPIEFDLVALTRKVGYQTLEIHGFEVRSSPPSSIQRQAVRPPNTQSLLQRRAQYCTHLWYGTTFPLDENDHQYLPDYVGILTLEREELSVIRPATSDSALGTDINAMTTSLLMRALNH